MPERFLLRKREVLKVRIFEYDQELEEKKYREAEYEHGRQDGYDVGIKEGRTAGIRTMVKNLAKQNIPLQQIAEAAGVDEKTVREWIETPAVKEKRE